MKDIKINMNNGNTITMRNSDSTMNVRLVKEDEQNWHFTDVHCNHEQLCEVAEALKLLGIQPGEKESDSLPLLLSFLLS